jgi:hypothetical protein
MLGLTENVNWIPRLPWDKTMFFLCFAIINSGLIFVARNGHHF